MLNVELKRIEEPMECQVCHMKVESEAPMCVISFNVLTTVCLCEDCGNDLSNDLQEEYFKI